MNENIDLTKILKNCPKGWKFWSPFVGEVEFEHIFEKKILVNISIDEHGTTWAFNADATTSIGDIKSPEIMLYPSKNQRDWSKFTAPWYKKERFDPKTLKPFDRVLVKNGAFPWRCDIFSYYRKNKRKTCYCISDNYIYDKCIPYNEDTNYLVGTCEEAPEFYRYWED